MAEGKVATDPVGKGLIHNATELDHSLFLSMKLYYFYVLEVGWQN